MNASAQSLSAAGWSLTVGAATLDPAAESAEFHAIYLGESLAPRAGGRWPCCRTESAREGRRWKPAQIAAQSFAEGFFGAPATTRSGRSRRGSLVVERQRVVVQPIAPRSEAAGNGGFAERPEFRGFKKIGVIHVGDCRVYRKRRGALEALTDDHLRPVAGDAVLTRALGADTDVQADFLDADAEILDRFILVSPGFAAHLPPARLNQLLSLDLDAESLARRAVAEAGVAATAVVIDIGGVPEPQFDDVAAAYADLPLRPPPQEGDNWDGFWSDAHSTAAATPC